MEKLSKERKIRFSHSKITYMSCSSLGTLILSYSGVSYILTKILNQNCIGECYFNRTLARYHIIWELIILDSGDVNTWLSVVGVAVPPPRHLDVKYIEGSVRDPTSGQPTHPVPRKTRNRLMKDLLESSFRQYKPHYYYYYYEALLALYKSPRAR